VGEQDLVHVDEAGSGAKQLALGTLAAIHQDAVAAAADEMRGQAPP
jgi:hypothetical protein